MHKINPDQIKRIVVRAPTWVGDAVMSLPAFRELRRLLPTAHLTVASPPGTADVFIDADFIDEVLVQKQSGFLSALTNARAWRQQRFDLAVLFQNAFAAAVTAFLARIPIRIGYDTDRRGKLLTTALPVPEWKHKRHESFYYLNVVAELERLLAGTSSIDNVVPQFALYISEQRKQAARDILIDHGAESGKPLAIICPGSVNSRAKRWPAESYAALADQLREEGFDVALIGSQSEMDVSQEVSSQARNRPILLTGKTSVAEAAAVISIADVLVTNDTGPAHIGAALNTPTIVIFGPTNPLTTYPFSAQAEIVRHPPDCAPCMLRDCPIDHRCMTAISTEDVFERALALLNRRNVQVLG